MERRYRKDFAGNFAEAAKRGQTSSSVTNGGVN
jgi:hypothetical protein